MGFQTLTKLSRQGQKSSLEKQLDFQEATRPIISDEYLMLTDDFLVSSFTTEDPSDQNLHAFPKEFRGYFLKNLEDPLRYTILGSNVIRVTVVKLQSLYDGQKYYEEQKDCIGSKLFLDIKNELGFSATFEYNRDGRSLLTRDLYLACFPGRVVKTDTGEWVPEEEVGGSAKFFALLAVRGVITEEWILEQGIATLGVKGLRFRKFFLETIAELRMKGLQKLFDEPLYK